MVIFDFFLSLLYSERTSFAGVNDVENDTIGKRFLSIVNCARGLMDRALVFGTRFVWVRFPPGALNEETVISGLTI